MKRSMLPRLLLFIGTLSVAVAPMTHAQSDADASLGAYFESETAILEKECLSAIHTEADWLAARDTYRGQLLEMLSLDPLPEKTPLNARVTGTTEAEIDGDTIIVENVVFESMPGFYVTGNLYRPKNSSEPCPTILYVCGHGPSKVDGISHGNKVSYQHHGIWFARHGYVCLTIDTVQMGEIEGIHHGTYRYGMWWWNSRGYSSAGAEAWNCVRALDYLESREEVDSKRFGVTGRSGGGAYSWWIAAIDDRIKAAVPVAGITSMRNHVVDGCVEGHCDCMFPVNTYRWDFPMIAALVAPRALLISNTDKDTIFPLDGVFQVHQQVKHVYGLLGAEERLGLHITEGPHKDSQNLRVHAFSWFDRFLKGNTPAGLIDKPAVPHFSPQQLKVLASIPENERTSKIHETFAAQAPAPDVPEDAEQWASMREGWMDALKQKVFRGWPLATGELNVKKVADAEANGIRFQVYEYDSQEHVRLPLFVVSPDVGAAPLTEIVMVPNQAEWEAFAGRVRTEFSAEIKPFLMRPVRVDAAGYAREVVTLKAESTAIIVMPPRGIGPTAWTGDDSKQVQIRRRFMLLGQTVDSMRVWDIQRGLQAASQLPVNTNARFLSAGNGMAVNSLYASLFVSPIVHGTLLLSRLPESHMEGPDYLNVLRFMDIPAVLAMATERGLVVVENEEPGVSEFAEQVQATLGWIK